MFRCGCTSWSVVHFSRGWRCLAFVIGRVPHTRAISHSWAFSLFLNEILLSFDAFDLIISRCAHAPIHRENVWRLKEEKQIDESNIYPISRRGTLRVLFHMSRLFDLINPLRGLRNEQRPIDDVPSPKFRVFGQNMCNVRVTGGLIIPWIRKSASLNFGQQLKYCRPAEPVTSNIWNSYFVGASTITRVTGHSFSPSPGCH